MKYKLCVFDVDGTLIGPDEVVPAETIDAMSHLQAQGTRICLATGRSLVETMPIWRQLKLAAPHEPMVLVGGSLVSEVDTGRTLCQRTIGHDDACEYAEALCRAGYSALAIVDVWRHGVDYYICESADAARVEQMWFSKMKVTVQRLAKFDGQLPSPLRINCVAPPEAAARLAQELSQRFAGRLNIHSIYAPNYDVTVVEAFAKDCTKWAGVMYVAQAYRIKPREIACFGDDVNDLPMIRSAGLGVAMPWAAPSVMQAAKAIAQPNLATFLRNLLAS